MRGFDEKSVRFTMVKKVVLHVMAYGKSSVIRLTEVYYSPLITHNIASHSKLELKGYGRKYKNNRRALISLTTGNWTFDVAMCNNMLVYETQNVNLNDGMISTIMAAIDGETKKKDEDNLQVKTLMHFHQRFGHLAYDTIEKMAREPNSGI